MREDIIVVVETATGRECATFLVITTWNRTSPSRWAHFKVP